jgi:MscS family membrane protein
MLVMPQVSWIMPQQGDGAVTATQAAAAPPAGAPASTAPATAGAATPPHDPRADLSDLADNVSRVLGPTFQKTSLYAWGGLMVAILVGLIAGRIVASVLLNAAQRLTARGWVARGSLLRHGARPANMAIFTVALMLGLQPIVMTDSVRELTWKIIGLLLILAVAWFLYNLAALMEIVLRRMLKRTDPKLVDTVVAMVVKGLRIFLLVMVALFVIQNIFKQDITAWLAGLGIAGLAVSLAAQDPIKNIFGSFTVLAERPFVLGDRIIFNNIDGTVEEIGFRSTRIRTVNGHLVTVPNMKFTDSVIENITRRPALRRVLNIGLTYDTPPDKIQQALAIVRGILEEPEVKEGLNLPDQPPQVAFNEMNADNLNIQVVYWFSINRYENDWWKYQAHAEQVNLKILRAFNDAGIAFAFPTRTLHLIEPTARPARAGQGRPA